MNKKRIAAILSRSYLDTDRKRKNALKKEELEEQLERNQKPVVEMTLSITWKKSATWGFNPHCEAMVKHVDFTRSTGHYTCSGCGYDKESTVIADAFNAFLKYRLWKLEKTRKEVPYGISLPSEYGPSYHGGVGTSCYYKIAEFIGGKFEHVAWSKDFDVYTFKMKEMKTYYGCNIYKTGKPLKYESYVKGRFVRADTLEGIKNLIRSMK